MARKYNTTFIDENSNVNWEKIDIYVWNGTMRYVSCLRDEVLMPSELMDFLNDAFFMRDTLLASSFSLGINWKNRLLFL